MPRPATPIGQLTEREEDVARLMARGYTNPQIAEELGITFSTAKWYVSQVIARLDATSREEAAEIWRREHAFPARLRRGFAAMATGAFLRRVAIGVGAATVVGVGLLVVVLAVGDHDDNSAGLDATPTLAAVGSPTTTPVLADDPCAEANLVNGFLVIGEGATPPDCTGLASSTPIPPIASDAKRYELAVPPGPWRQENIEPTVLASGVRLDGVRYYNNETGDLALATYRQLWSGLPGHVIEGSSPTAVDYLPGPGIVLHRNASTAAYWSEDDSVFGVEVFDSGGSNLTIRQAVALAVYFAPVTSDDLYWDPDAGRFVDQAPWLYPDNVASGSTLVDQVIRLSTPIQQSLEELVDYVTAPCAASPMPSIRPAPACLDGEPEGTLVPALLLGGCPDNFAPIEARDADVSDIDILRIIAGEQSRLFAIADAPPNEYGVEYVAAFSAGKGYLTVYVTENGVPGVAWSCDPSEYSIWLRSVDSWLLPPLYPLPG